MQYIICGDNVKRVHYPIPRIKMKFDDIVDRSTFTLEADRENARKSILMGQSMKGVFDGDSMPTDLELSIRSGKLDKAEIDDAKRAIQRDIKKDSDSVKKDKVEKQSQKIEAARQEHLDKLTGFTGIPQNQVENTKK